MRKTIFILSILICCCVGFTLGIWSQSDCGYQLKSPIIHTENESEKPASFGNVLADGKAAVTELAESVIDVLLPPSDPADMPVTDSTLTTSDEAGTEVPPTYPNKNIMGHLIVGNYSATVRSDIKEETLKLSPGWMPESAKPGRSGMSIIFGHRNRNHLKLLEDAAVGDPIVFRYLDNSTATYIVEDIQIFEHTADWTLPDVEGDVLVIATCYPFHYTGNAPGKFQVVARLVQ